MTVIAYDGKSIAADRRSTWDGEPVPHGSLKLKLLRYRDRRFIVAHSGFEAQAMRMFDHHLHGQRHYGVLTPYSMIGDEKASVLVVELLPEFCHKATMIDCGGGETDVTDANTTLGSGGAYAVGAMDAGADARNAVLIASFRNTGCGDGVDCYVIADAHGWPADKFKSEGK